MAIELTLGATVITPSALDALNGADIPAALRRHASGDWGDVSPDDWSENNLSVEEGRRILSAYRDARGIKFWVITEADRSATTVLLPEDY
ncbi:MAG: hypothetical protein AB7K52_00605 [Phycisphaerales bacterium]